MKKPDSDDSIRDILGLVYKSSLDSYENKISQLEKVSSFDHISANFNFRQSVKNKSFIAINDFKEYEKQVQKITNAFNSNQFVQL